MGKYILAFDQGTTSSRAIVFDRSGKTVSAGSMEFRQIFPRPGWVEHDPEEIWESQISSAREALSKASLTYRDIEAIGITNQRETTIIWDRATGKPVYNAVVWQCRRTTDICSMLKEKGYEKIFREKTGLLLDPYFSGTKIKWILENDPGLHKRAENGNLCFGTVDSWLIYKLTGKHRTDSTNASRTLLYNIRSGEWDRELLDILDIPRSILPEVISSCGDFGITGEDLLGGGIPVCGVAGDQQASLFGQACFNRGDIKNTYGTGCFALMHTGKDIISSKSNLLTTVAVNLDGLEYALEGSVFIGGAVIQWIRDQLKLIKSAGDSEALALSVPDSGGVYFVPAFVGLGAPYWDPDVRGIISGITRGTSSAHITRAALESIAFQTYDLIRAMKDDTGGEIRQLKVDGGATHNSFLMQFQADLLGIPVILSETAETTALGAAYLAGLYSGFWNSKDEIEKNRIIKSRFEPSISGSSREKLLRCWQNAVEAAIRSKPVL